MRGRAGDSKSEIKAQFGLGYLNVVHLLSKLGHDINDHKKSKKIITYQFFFF